MHVFYRQLLIFPNLKDTIAIYASCRVVREHKLITQTILTVFASQVSKEGNRLNGFPQAHLVSKYAIKLSLVHRCQPIQSNMLILSQSVLQQKWDGRLHLSRCKYIHVSFISKSHKIATHRMKTYRHVYQHINE